MDVQIAHIVIIVNKQIINVYKRGCWKSSLFIIIGKIVDFFVYNKVKFLFSKDIKGYRIFSLVEIP